MNLLIVSQLGVVHRDGHTLCGSVNGAAKRKNITALQARVFQLGHCGICFPDVDEFNRLIGKTLILR